MRVTRSLDNYKVKHEYENPSSENIVIPDDSLTLREILDGWARGVLDPRAYERNCIYDSDTNGNLDLDSDIIDNVEPTYTEVFERSENAQKSLQSELQSIEEDKQKVSEREKLSNDIASTVKKMFAS